MTVPQATGSRSFLFLQGPLSPLYRRLADELARDGHAVHRINLCFGDWLHWKREGAVNYRGRSGNWAAFVAAFLLERGITDVILHGDQRPYHKAAGEMARAAGVRVIVTELGYLRPDWMTLERDATSAGSYFPRAPDAIRQLAQDLPQPDLVPRYATSFWRVAAPDVAYNLSSTLLWFLYPHFRRHTIYFPPVEYAAWLCRLLTKRRRNAAAFAAIQQTIASRTPFFVLPLQLEGDFQIRAYSPFHGQTEGLDHILGSFARAAPAGNTLLVKSHPLDNGLEHWAREVARIAGIHGLTDRVQFIDGGTLTELWPHARGLVTINSSAGLEAVMAGVPVKALGPAIYDVAGLTDQRPLDDFWAAPRHPDSRLAADFVRALAGSVQVRGTLYSEPGLEAAVAGMTARILADDFLEQR